MNNTFILCDLLQKFKKIIQRTEKEALSVRYVVSGIRDYPSMGNTYQVRLGSL